MKKILHITPHLGGGVGKVLLNWISKDKRFSHRIICLDYANKEAKKIAKEKKISLEDCFADKHEELLNLIKDADIVLVHFWNHPLLYDFIVREQLPPCRIIMWSHISGFHPPYIFPSPLFDYADLFVFTTQISYDTKEIKKLDEEHKKKLRVIWSTGGVYDVIDIKSKRHKGFNIGYIGTVDYCKLHKDFLEMSTTVDIPDVNFIVIGCGENKQLEKDIIRKGWKDEFQFLGYVDDIRDYLPLFDVFGYPLSRHHYGTCDQALAEAMACGVVPVVLNNKMEMSMVQDGITGLVAKNQEGYRRAIEFLHDHPDIKKRLSMNTKRLAKKRFSLEYMMKEWNQMFNECMKISKHEHSWTGEHHGQQTRPFEVFQESIGGYKLGDSPLWRAKTKGTVNHYLSFFPEDKTLQHYKERMDHV